MTLEPSPGRGEGEEGAVLAGGGALSPKTRTAHSMKRHRKRK